MKKNQFEVIRGFDYTIRVKDQSNREIVFRDITGNDLEFLDLLFKSEEESEDKKIQLSFDDIKEILNRLSVKKINFNHLTQRVLSGLFDCIKTHILCNYIPKFEWLRACYGIQNGSFMNISEMEKVPMTKFIAMMQIHKDAMDSLKNE